MNTLVVGSFMQLSISFLDTPVTYGPNPILRPLPIQPQNGISNSFKNQALRNSASNNSSSRSTAPGRRLISSESSTARGNRVRLRATSSSLQSSRPAYEKSANCRSQPVKLHRWNDPRLNTLMESSAPAKSLSVA